LQFRRKSEQPDKTGLVFLLSNFLISLFPNTARESSLFVK
jgi:hypothetical protein